MTDQVTVKLSSLRNIVTVVAETDRELSLKHRVQLTNMIQDVLERFDRLPKDTE